MDKPSKPANDDETKYLELLRDEGLRLLKAFRQIENRSDRELVTHLAERLANTPKPKSR